MWNKADKITRWFCAQLILEYSKTGSTACPLPPLSFLPPVTSPIFTTMSTMEHTAPSDWDSVLQFVADPLDLDFSEKAAEPVVLQPGGAIQVPTPPVRFYSSTSCLSSQANSNHMTAPPSQTVPPRVLRLFPSPQPSIRAHSYMNFLRISFSSPRTAFSSMCIHQSFSLPLTTISTTSSRWIQDQQKIRMPCSPSLNTQSSSTLSCI